MKTLKPPPFVQLTSELSMASFRICEWAFTACTAASWAVIAWRVVRAVALRAPSRVAARAGKNDVTALNYKEKRLRTSPVTHYTLCTSLRDFL